jgi:excisionase family DNA binding protein
MPKAKPQVVPREIPPQIEPIAFDIPGAAKFLSATEWAVRRLIYAGKLSYKRVGKRIIIPRTVLEEFATTGLKREGTGGRAA